MRVNIIGGGLAGCALAYVLKNNGIEPVIYEASSCLAAGASGNDVGLYNPRLSAQFDGMAQFYSAAFFQALEVFEDFDGAIDWNPCGALTFLVDERKTIRFRKTAASWGWSDKDMRLVDARSASDIAGVEVPYECLYLPRSGNISPKKLCYEYARGVEVHLNYVVDDLDALDGDISVLACGAACLNFSVASHLPLKYVRGQVSYIAQTAVTQDLKVALSYGGHFAPARNGVHCLGATFQPWLDHSHLRDEDDLSNLDKLFSAVPSLEGAYKVVDRRASVRTTARDHFPVVGQLSERVYISTAHGSYGILSSLLSAKLLSDCVVGDDKEGECSMRAVLSPTRFKG
ncbi:MAG: hypothetical protein COA45_01980 [Zetaproteobacteria bacterium]|nr:MAG: hypothetical protein COA45_01980 [Zetaproteobacteria bacterium]